MSGYMQAAAITGCVDAIAADVARLRRVTDSESSGRHALDRISNKIEGLDAMTQPTAAELAIEFFCVCGDHDLAVDEALRVTDRRARQLRRLLGDSEGDELVDLLEIAQRRERDRVPAGTGAVVPSSRPCSDRQIAA
jgi:hypothetical protein